MNSKKVELTTGRVVEVYAPPIMKVIDMMERKYPPVEKKIVTVETVTGETQSMVIEDDPQHDRDVLERDEKVANESQELYTLLALKDEKAPDGFDMETFGELLRYSYPEWEPREGSIGRRLDWIEWDLLGNPADQTSVQKAINELISIPKEVVKAAKKSFPSDVEK